MGELIDIRSKLPTWTVCGDRPVMIAPSGREYRVSHSRAMAVDVLRRVHATAIAAMSPREREAMWARPPAAFFSTMVQAMARTGSEDDLGPLLCAWFDCTNWDLTWQDAMSGGGDG